MQLYKILAKSIREYKRDSIKAPVFVSMEVLLECIIPFVIARLVNEIKAGCEISTIVWYGAVLVVMAGFSLLFRALAGTACATASAGFAKNLRADMYAKICGYSFENIDKFSTSSLVTRMTTDVANVQLAYMMIIPHGHPLPADVAFCVCHGVCHGRENGVYFSDCRADFGRRAIPCHPAYHAAFPQGVPQI